MHLLHLSGIWCHRCRFAFERTCLAIVQRGSCAGHLARMHVSFNGLQTLGVDEALAIVQWDGHKHSFGGLENPSPEVIEVLGNWRQARGHKAVRNE